MSENFTNLVDNNAEFKPLMDLIEQIMDLPDQNLSDEMVNSLGQVIDNAFTPTMREQSIEEMIKGFKEAGLSRQEVVKTLTDSKQAMKDFIDELKPSAQKRVLLDSVFGVFYNLFDTVLEKYLVYDIKLGIQLDEGAHIPTYAHESDAAADVYALVDQTIPPHSFSNVVHTGVYFNTPPGWKLKLSPRSSIGAKTPLRLSNMIGLIDSDYRGELMILFDNLSDSVYEIHKGDRIAQVELEPVYRFKAIQISAVDATERNIGGFGSTGK